jgi:hypothetical protein
VCAWLENGGEVAVSEAFVWFNLYFTPAVFSW